VLALSPLLSGAAPTLELKPGLWSHDSEIWINGRSLKPAQQALHAKVRSKLSDAQKREYDREQGAGKQSCLTPQQARIDLARYLEAALNDADGPWRCEANASKLDGSAAEGSYACRTSGGGLTQGRFSASYGPTSYKLELNGRGNAVDGRTGEALGTGEVDQRMLSTGRWLGGSC
jgi:hypothetical protein